MWAFTALRNSNFTDVEAPLCIHFTHDDSRAMHFVKCTVNIYVVLNCKFHIPLTYFYTLLMSPSHISVTHFITKLVQSTM